jgi:hypothetical protein
MEGGLRVEELGSRRELRITIKESPVFKGQVRNTRLLRSFMNAPP